MGQTYTKNVFIVYLTFKLSYTFCILILTTLGWKLG